MSDLKKCAFIIKKALRRTVGGLFSIWNDFFGLKVVLEAQITFSTYTDFVNLTSGRLHFSAACDINSLPFTVLKRGSPEALTLGAVVHASESFTACGLWNKKIPSTECRGGFLIANDKILYLGFCKISRR